MSSYEIGERVGAGGMGEVYHATHIGLKRPVAIKFMHPQCLRDPFFIERFERERLISSRLDHPSIVRVYDGGEDFRVDGFEGRPYLVMEWLDGETLNKRIERGPLPLDEAVRIAKGVLSALDYAHTRPEQVVHRDVKPHNVFLCKDGTIKLLDFGIAKALSDSGGATGHTSLTVRMGTVEYMAPEQIISGTADPRTDIYMVGILLYEMLAGRPPFTDKDPKEVYNMQVKQPPPALPDAVPFALKQIVLRALQKEPKQRFQSAMEMFAALSDIAPSHLVPQPTSSSQEPILSSGTAPVLPTIPLAVKQPPHRRHWIEPKVMPVSRSSGRAYIVVPLLALLLGIGGAIAYVTVPAVHDYFQPPAPAVVTIQGIEVLPKAVEGGGSTSIIVRLSSGCSTPDQVHVKVQRGSGPAQEIKDYELKSNPNGSCALFFPFVAPNVRKTQKLKIAVSAADGKAWLSALTVTRGRASDAPVYYSYDRSRSHIAHAVHSSRPSVRKPTVGQTDHSTPDIQSKPDQGDDSMADDQKPDQVQGDDSAPDAQKPDASQPDSKSDSGSSDNSGSDSSNAPNQ